MTFTLEVVVEPSTAEAVGAAWDGSRVLFSRPAANELWSYDPSSGSTGVFRRFTGGVTGVTADRDGRVYGCQTPSRRIVTYHADGSTSVLATKLDGRFHNFPRYAAVDGRGRVWFADPKLGLRAPGPQVLPLLDHASVLRLDPVAGGSWSMARMTFDTRHPTVVAVSDDESTLYVVETTAGDCQELRAYAIADDGLGDRSVLATFTTTDGHPPVSGMAVGAHGHLIVAGGKSVSVLTDGGESLQMIEVPRGATDVTLGGAGCRSLYITTGAGALIQVDDPGDL
jgi:gluconolactonase